LSAPTFGISPVGIAVGEADAVLPIPGRVHARLSLSQILPVQCIKKAPIYRGRS